MYTCASCTLRSCQKGGGDLPRNCPMRDPEFFDRLLERYWSEENHDFFVTSAAIESAGYCRWPRLKEIVEFSRSMHYQKLGLAFCAALKKEAAVVERVLRNNGFQVVSVICKTGGLDKSRAGVPEECKLQPGQFEAMCNPIAQAELLNSQDTQFNICLGLCVGHDSLFYQYSKALVTTLVVKDRGAGPQPSGRHPLRRHLFQGSAQGLTPGRNDMVKTPGRQTGASVSPGVLPYR
ncbi:MAG: DUF1847 domain-containing protein [Eubacteriales bacterium]